MALPDRQYEYVDGHWRDVWNDIDDTQPFPDWNDCGDTWSSEVLRSRCGWCGCVDTDALADAMRAYLTGEWGMYDKTVLLFNADDLTQTLIALAADAAGFTEHGGTIYGAWITPEGQAWLKLSADVGRPPV